MMRRSSQFLRSAAVCAALGLTLSACGDNGDEANGGTDNGDGATESGGTVTLGIIPSWTDGLSSAFLWQVILEEQGYEVEIEELTEAAPLYTGVAQGDIDVYPSAWLPLTHGDYWEDYQDDLENLGSYYEGAVLTLAVPEYTDIDSIEDLNDNAEQFDNRVVGIEPGAGHMQLTSGTVFPEYGLDENFELVESSTTAMLAELDNAISAEEDIVVTLWRPFWAYGQWDMKDLDDPEGHLGEPEELTLIANSEFSSEFPEVAEWMSNLSLSDEEYAELENLVVNEYDNTIEGAEVWVENNRDLVDELVN